MICPKISTTTFNYTPRYKKMVDTRVGVQQHLVCGHTAMTTHHTRPDFTH